MTTLEQLDETQRLHDRKITVLETVVSELRDHNTKVEDKLEGIGDKLDKIHTAYITMQGEYKALADVIGYVNQNSKSISHIKEQDAKNQVYIDKWMKKDIENSSLIKKYAAQIIMMIMLALWGMFINYSVAAQIQENYTITQQ